MVKTDSPIISVIVPIYGVDKYLDDCVSSIVNQTYSNLEIILVDDKAIDNSGAMCDKWATKDARINVVHKTKNEGLNMARRSGWDVSTGELVTFVDGDDMIDKKYIETLYESLVSEDADIAAMGYSFFNHDEQPTLSQQSDYKKKVLTRAKIIEHHATQQEQLVGFHGNLTTVHCKLFKRAIVENVQWDKSNYSIGEDDFFSIMCYAACERVVLAYTQLYYYRVSPNSISRSKELNVRYNGEKVSIFTLVRNYKDLSTKLFGKNFFDETNYRTYVLYLYYINLILAKSAWSDEDFAELQSSMKRDIKSLLEISKYKIDRDLLENVKRNGSISFLTAIIDNKQRELSSLYVEKDTLIESLRALDTEKVKIEFEKNKLWDELNSHLGIKRSARLFAGNVKRKITKSRG